MPVGISLGNSSFYHVTALFSLNMLSGADFLSSIDSEEESCSVTQLCVILCNPMDCSTPGFPVIHYFPEFSQTDVHWVGDAIQPFHPLSPSSHPALNLSHYQDLFHWVGSSHQVAKILEHHLQHQSEGEIAFFKIYLRQGWPGSGICSSSKLKTERHRGPPPLRRGVWLLLAFGPDIGDSWSLPDLGTYEK